VPRVMATWRNLVIGVLPHGRSKEHRGRPSPQRPRPSPPLALLGLG
jgi:hypothetical protein